MHLIHSKQAADWLQNAKDKSLVIQPKDTTIKERKPHEYNEFTAKVEARILELFYNKSMELPQIAAYLNIPFYHVLDTINK